MYSNLRNPLSSNLKYLGPALCISLLLPGTSLLADATVECNVGTSSFSTECGINSSAPSTQAMAIGNGSTASGTTGRSTAVGTFSSAASTSSTAIGSGAQANSVRTTSLGRRAGYNSGTSVIDSESSVVIGYYSNIGPNSPGAIAIGARMDGNINNSQRGAEAVGAGAIAIGTDVYNNVPNSMLINVPFRIESDKAIGTDSTLIVEDTATTVGVRNVVRLKNFGGVGFVLEDTNLDNAWDFRTAGNGGFLVSNIGVAGSKLQINQDGSLFLVDNNFIFNGPTGNLTLAGNSTALAHISTSSREVKTDFAKVNPKEVMDKIKSMEVTEWRYKDNAAKGRHIGPMAEDFYSLFKLGADDKHVAATDMASIALIAAKELQKKSDVVSIETKALKAENNELREQLLKQEEAFNKRLSSLEKLVTNLASGQSILPTEGKQVVLNQ